MFPVMKCRVACTILLHSLCVLQNFQGADIRYNKEKKFRRHFMFIHTLFLKTKTKKQSTYCNIAYVHLAMRPPVHNAVSS